MQKLVLSIREVAECLGLSMPTAYALTENAGFPVIRLGHKKLVPVADLERWLSRMAENQATIELKNVESADKENESEA